MCVLASLSELSLILFTFWISLVAWLSTRSFISISHLLFAALHVPFYSCSPRTFCLPSRPAGLLHGTGKYVMEMVWCQTGLMPRNPERLSRLLCIYAANEKRQSTLYKYFLCSRSNITSGVHRDGSHRSYHVDLLAMYSTLLPVVAHREVLISISCEVHCIFHTVSGCSRHSTPQQAWHAVWCWSVEQASQLALPGFFPSRSLASIKFCKKKFMGKAWSPCCGIWNSFLHRGQSASSPVYLSMQWPWRHWRQNEWRHGSERGSLKSSRQIEQVAISVIRPLRPERAAAIVDRRWN